MLALAVGALVAPPICVKPTVISATNINCSLPTKHQLFNGSPALAAAAKRWSGLPQDFAKAFEGTVFLDGFLDRFYSVPVETHALLRSFGLQRTSTVLEVGCGMLRTARELIVNGVQPGNFCGIEPNATNLAIGVRLFLGHRLLELQQPRFSLDASFNMAIFGKRRFDFVYARSVWSHATLKQIKACLDTFVLVAKPTSLLLASLFVSPDGVNKYGSGKHFTIGLSPKWMGNSHDDFVKGWTSYGFDTIARVCAERGLRARQLTTQELISRVQTSYAKTDQDWVVISVIR